MIHYTSDYHTPVLLEESVELMNISPEGIYADLTFGGGGHTRHIESRNSGKRSLKGSYDVKNYYLCSSNTLEPLFQ